MFVLAHLSDPHIPPLPKPRLPELVGKRATGYFNWWLKRGVHHREDVLAEIVADLKAQAPHHIAVTGDLANLSLPAEFPIGLAFLKDLGSAEQVTVIPGNHDIYVHSHARAHFAWRDFLLGDAAQEPSYPFVRRRGSLAIVGLSTGLPTAPFLATGKLGREQLDALAQTLDTLGEERVFRAVLIHHPPAGTRPLHKRLTDAAAFREVIARSGAELILTGHDHRALHEEIAGPRGPVPVIGVPSASAAHDDPRGRAAYNLYRISGEAGRWRCEVERRGLDAAGSGVISLERFVLGARKAASRSPSGKRRRFNAAQTAKRRRTGSRSRRSRR
jgi:3',5'-cyclic AMP phosphodiesterase CpdA